MRRILVLLIICTMIIVTGCRSGSDSADTLSDADSSTISLNRLNLEIEEEASNPDLYEKRATYYLNARNIEHALKDINKAISLDDQQPLYYITLSDILLVMGNSANCMTALNRAVVLDPENQDAHLRLAKLHLILRNYTAAFRVTNELIRSDEYNPKAYFIRALGYLEKGDTAIAVGDLMKAVDQDQLYYDAYMQLGDLFSVRNDPLAEGYFTNALRIRPKSREALYMLGMYYQNTEQFEKALLTYDRLIAAEPSFPNAPYNKGYIYLVYIQDFPKAVEAFTEAIRIDSAYIDAIFNRGYAYELNGQLEQARSDYKTTLILNINNQKAIEGMNRLDRAGVRR
ncbi:MAG: tetratricopeptide repeat protein [Bacteroidales bacterium]|nr:tetratricopeptide repeat protein [Bacteroidota bacterium]MBL6949342.1 tetratricopeptide repeat protein [Bacteroidales bacterium]